MTHKIFSFLLFTALSISSVFAATTPTTKELQEPIDKILQKKAAIDKISPTPIPGIFEVVVGSDIFYSTSDGRYVIYGHLIDTSNQEPVSLTDATTQTVRKQIIDAIDEKTMIIFEPKGKTKATITTFTDIDCGYCRELHKNINELSNAGIRVRYVAFPRTGVNSESYVKAVNVWCAENPQEAFTQAMNGKTIPATPGCTKSSIIDEDLRLVSQLNIDGTPVSVLEDGRLLPGYYPPTALIQLVL